MSILSTNQLTPGGRNYNKDYPYIIGNVTTKPTVAVDGVVTTEIDFTGGEIEFESFKFSLDGLSFDVADLGSLVANGQKFILAAVPGYDEPTSQAAAESAGVDYYVTSTKLGESLLHYYIPSAIQTQVDAAGGISKLQKLVLNGLATTSQVSLYNSYKQAEQKYLDPRTSVGPLTPTKVELVLIEVVAQTNYSDDNYYLELPEDEFKYLRATNPRLTKIQVLSEAEATSRYAGREYVIKEGFHYASEADAVNNVNGTALDLSSGVAATIFTTAGTHVRVIEYFISSNTEVSRRGNKPRVVRFLTKRDSAFLGRTLPILLANESHSLVHGRTHYSPLTRDPAFTGLIEFEIDGSGDVVITKEIFQSYLD